MPPHESALGGDYDQLIDAANKYLSLADHYASELDPPLLLIVRGLTGVGKSTLAATLAESLDLELLQTDAIRREMFGPSETPSAYGAGNYSPDQRSTVYNEMFRRAASLLDARLSVVLDGTFLTTKLRTQAASLARRHSASPHLIHCRCPVATAIQRITARRTSDGSWSESQPDFHRLQQSQEEPDPPGLTACQVDTTESVPAMLRAVFDQIRTARV